MKDIIFADMLSDALTNERDVFVSDWALSSIWDDSEDAEIPQERIEYLAQIWDAAHRSIKDIAAAAGMTNRALAIHFGIPVRTVEDWSMGKHLPPTYILLMMQECLGLLVR